MRWIVMLLAMMVALGLSAQPKSQQTAILAALNPALRKMSAVDLKLKALEVRIQADWAFAVVEPTAVDGRAADGVGIGLLQRVKGKWIVREAEIGSDGLTDSVKAWRKKHPKAPAALFKTKPGLVP